ncbi:MAG: cell division protein FtsZ [Actinomycetota bacterium]|nr:cell division protein FtsZ [Actinomycetota bacterium]
MIGSDSHNHNYVAMIRVVGVGGAGGNAVNRMIESGLNGVEFIVVNTDAQVLAQSEAGVTLQIGRELTKGLGAGSDPSVGRQAALDHEAEIEDVLMGSDMVFIAAGEGGGTGTGAAPVVAEIAKKAGALTIGVVTKPFSFEGSRRTKQAEDGIKALRDQVDTLIIIPNDRVIAASTEKTSFVDAFKMVDDVLLQAVQGITDLITNSGIINTDFADVRRIMSSAGTAIMGVATASGEDRAIKAMTMATTSHLLETTMRGAKAVLVNFAGSSQLTMMEIFNASARIEEMADRDAEIIFGAVCDESLGDAVKVTVIATGFNDRPSGAATAFGEDREPLAKGGDDRQNIRPIPTINNDRSPSANVGSPINNGNSAPRGYEASPTEDQSAFRSVVDDDDDDDPDVPDFIKRLN